MELLGRLATLGSDPSEFCESFNLHADTAYRFLKARAFDVDQAEAMFRQSLQWRKEISLQAQCKEWAAELAKGKSRAARVQATRIHSLLLIDTPSLPSHTHSLTTSSLAHTPPLYSFGIMPVV